MSISSKLAYRYNLNKNLNRFFSRNWQVDLKMHIEIHRIQNRQSSQYLISGLTIKATMIKMAWYGWKKREIHQRNTTENPEIDIHVHGHWFPKRHQDNSMKKKKKKRKALFTSDTGITGYEQKLTSFPTSYHTKKLIWDGLQT